MVQPTITQLEKSKSENPKEREWENLHNHVGSTTTWKHDKECEIFSHVYMIIRVEIKENTLKSKGCHYDSIIITRTLKTTELTVSDKM